MGRFNQNNRSGERNRSGGHTNGNEKKKEKEMKFATQEQTTKNLYGTFNAIKMQLLPMYRQSTSLGQTLQKRFEMGNNSILVALDPFVK